MNVGEYGIAFNLNVGYDISGNSTLALIFTRQDGTTFTANKPDVSVGNAPINTTSGPFAANQYCVYLFKNGDLTVSGTYSVRLTYNDATKHLVSDATTFTVNP
jgi:hypothetical protein